MADQGSSSSTPATMSTRNEESNEESLVSLVYRIPVKIRELNKGAFIPSVVSIGPINIDVEHLEIKAEEKFEYMQELFFRCGYKCREACMDAMLEMESKNWYGELKIRRADTEESRKFAQMMLFDGCFIIELLYRNYQRITYSSYIRDPVLDNYSMKCAVQHDLIRLENQIPFPVLEKLFNLTVGTIKHHDNQFSLKKLIFLFFKGVMGLQRMPDWEHPLPFHILDYFHFFYRPYVNRFPVNTEWYSGDSFPMDNEQSIFRYSATQLDLAGVKFRPGSRINLFDVRFRTNPSCFQLFRSRHFEIPPFPITSSSETFLRNLIALEQCYEDRYHYFTSHACLMDKLIDTAKDVDLLVEAGVINNYLGSSEEVALLYNNITQNVYVGGFHFTEPCNEVTEYCNRFWPRCLAKLKRDYFGNPWTGLSVFAAFSIFVYTLLQTIYAMK